MGLFGSTTSQPTPPKPEASTDGGYIAPDRSARAQCWEGRDAFFQCLDKNGIVDSVREDGKAKSVCGTELKQFEKHCASSWVRLEETVIGCFRHTGGQLLGGLHWTLR